MAGETSVHVSSIRCSLRMQHKKVTVIHHREQLINDKWPEKFRKDVERRWGLRGVNFLLGDGLDVPPEGTIGVTTHKGRHIPDADLVVSIALCSLEARLTDL